MSEAFSVKNNLTRLLTQFSEGRYEVITPNRRTGAEAEMDLSPIAVGGKTTVMIQSGPTGGKTRQDGKRHETG
jgi:hypothetical protein